MASAFVNAISVSIPGSTCSSSQHHHLGGDPLKTTTFLTTLPSTNSHHHVSKTPLHQSPTMALGGSRKFLIGGNWKCNLDKSSITKLIESFNSGPKLDPETVEVVCAPPSVYIEYTKSKLRSDFKIGGQNCWVDKGGAYTGELDGKMLKDVGCEYVILGHSERRHIDVIHESDEVVARKVAYALGCGLKVILCVGEKAEERDRGDTMDVCGRQLKAVKDVIGDDWKSIVIAYEPIWAIGTGNVATPQQAEETHEGIREWLKANVSKDVAQNIQILYGGSVSPGNCQELAKLENVDGFLVGGASLKPGFLDIVASHKAAMASPV